MTAPRAAVITVSDRSSRGERPDGGGPAVADALRGLGYDVAAAEIVADERAEIAGAIRRLAAAHDLVVTTGGTGLAPRDVTPEATRDVLDREAAGFGEEMRRRGAATFARAILTRATAGTVGRCVVVNLPGSPRGAVECLGWVADALRHAVDLQRPPADGGAHSCARDAAKP
ncbi:MAG: Molybdopterin adenylyltransferase [Planctomycetes bacterium]|nr:Molybdopterin adenylyltransferase [Planctomycetota bacterium]